MRIAVPSIWKEERSVESFEIDMSGGMRPHMLFAHMLNGAWGHANPTAYGYKELADRNLMWVLNKIKVSITRMPRWKEKISVETWGKGVERFYALRDFAISSAEGENLASATSAWMILDRDSYRPQKLDEMKRDWPWVTDRVAMETDLAKVAESTKGEDRASFRVVFSDIDVNNHVTATRYLQWLADSHPQALLERMQLSALEISYLAEAVLGDEVTASIEQMNDHELGCIRRTRDMKELCRAKMTWRQG